MSTNDIKERIVSHLQSCDQSHPATVADLAFAVFGEEIKVDKQNEWSYIKQVYIELLKLESEGKVQNVNRLPPDNTYAFVNGSQWLLK